jgi:hypothetical protein
VTYDAARKKLPKYEKENVESSGAELGRGGRRNKRKDLDDSSSSDEDSLETCTSNLKVRERNLFRINYILKFIIFIFYISNLENSIRCF